MGLGRMLVGGPPHIHARKREVNQYCWLKGMHPIAQLV